MAESTQPPKHGELRVRPSGRFWQVHRFHATISDGYWELVSWALPTEDAAVAAMIALRLEGK